MARLYWVMVAVTAVYFVAVAIWSAMAISGQAEGMAIFDARMLGYSTEDARAFLTALSPSGLASYQGPMRRLDTVFPALLAATLILGFWQFHGRRAAGVLTLVALFAAWLDFQENAAVADLLALGPAGIDEDVVTVAALLTMLKWLAYLVAMAGFAVGLWRMRRRT